MTTHTISLAPLAANLALECAKTTGLSWKSTQGNSVHGNNSYVVESDSGHTIVLAFVWNEANRVHVYGRYPSPGIKRASGYEETVSTSEYLNETSPDIRVDGTRNVDAAARDIVRRFLSRYLPLHARMTEKWKARVKSLTEKEEVFEELSKMPGFKGQRNDELRHVHTHWVDKNGSLVNATFRVGAGTELYFEASNIPKELAIRLANVVKTYSDEHRVN